MTGIKDKDIKPGVDIPRTRGQGNHRVSKFPVDPASDDSWLGQVRHNTERREG